MAVYQLNGKPNGEIELNPAIFEAPINRQLLDDVVSAYAGNQRRGTHDTKERKEISGGGKKPWKQKGTGRARQGSTRAPQWRGGGTVFGPTPRDYDTRIPKAMRERALISALSLKRQEEKLTVIEEIELSAPKTKELFRAMTALKLEGVRTLCVVSDLDEKLKRASGNLKEIFSIKRANELNAYHVMRRKQLVIEKSALNILGERLAEASESGVKKEPVAA